jgi:hypothetical protein
MTDRAKFEQMLEYLINEDKAKAEELFHELVVSKSREIYENLLDDDIQVEEKEEDEDEEVEENFGFDTGMQQEVGGDPADDMLGDIEADDENGMDDMGDEEGGDEPATKDDVMDIKDALDDLKAEFEAMLGGESGEEETGDEEGEEGEEGNENPFAKEEYAFEASDEEDEEEETDESVVREYVEKVGAPKHGDNGVNAKSIVAGKNDMGGTTANLRGGESNKGGTQGGLLNPSTKDISSGNVNVPGGKAGIKSLKSVSKPAGGDNGQNTKSIVGK